MRQSCACRGSCCGVTLVSGALLGTALVVASIGLVALAARMLLPELSWTAAFAIGIVVAVFDTRLFNEAKGRPRVPRALSDVLKARELVGRVVILATFGLFLEFAQAGRPPGLNVLAHYLIDIPVGALLGAAIGYGTVRLRSGIDLRRSRSPSRSRALHRCASSHRNRLSIVATITARPRGQCAAHRPTHRCANLFPETRISACFLGGGEPNDIGGPFFLAGLAMLRRDSAWSGHSGGRSGGRWIARVVLAVHLAFSLAAAGFGLIADALQAQLQENTREQRLRSS